MKRAGTLQTKSLAGSKGSFPDAAAAAANKKPRFNNSGGDDNDDFRRGNSEYGAGGDEGDDMMFEQKIEGIEEIEGGQSSEITSNGKWIRPVDVAYDTSKPLLVHWLDIDMISGAPLDYNPAGGDILGSKEGPVPVIRMFGVTPDGYSTMLAIHGFTPYFYASFNGVNEIPKQALGGIRAAMDQKVRILCFSCGLWLIDVYLLLLVSFFFLFLYTYLDSAFVFFANFSPLL
jgi:hypothetical protein